MQTILSEIQQFLGASTPHEWVMLALDNKTLLLIDHAHCEKKAASTALNLMFRYVQYPDLLQQLSRLAREELRHFEKVLSLMTKLGIRFDHLPPGHYAEKLRAPVATFEPKRLIDLLIVSAFIEARSCERFALLVPHLQGEMQDFYASLLASEARHYQLYLNFAQRLSQDDISERLDYFRHIENNIILAPEEVFRFHSGRPLLT
ncbi:MAG: tRNA-(ms[2]io[6]A)-hydroxylase [Legionellales bacterium]|nr:tRNA-(ms[2]io[6]A)-hydroxylase [Legionellales bacterium]